MDGSYRESSSIFDRGGNDSVQDNNRWVVPSYFLIVTNHEEKANELKTILFDVERVPKMTIVTLLEDLLLYTGLHWDSLFRNWNFYTDTPGFSFFVFGE